MIDPSGKDTVLHSRRKAGTHLFVRVVFVFCALSCWAFEVIPLSNVPQTTESADGTPLQVEFVEVGRLTATPDQISRPAGKFILVLVNKTVFPLPSLQIDSAGFADGILDPKPLIKLINSKALYPQKVAVLVDLPIGEFHVKSLATFNTFVVLTGK